MMLCDFVGNEARYFILKDKILVNENVVVVLFIVLFIYIIINGYFFVGMFFCIVI